MKSAIRLAARLAGACVLTVLILLVTACGDAGSATSGAADGVAAASADAPISTRVESGKVQQQRQGDPAGGKLGQVPESQPINQPLQPDEGTVVYVLSIPGIHCEGCVSTIKSALNKVDGVRDARVSLDQEKAWVKADEQGPTVETIVAAIETSGYDATPIATRRR